MALPTFTSIALPQDTQIVDANGRISQSWYRVFQALIQLLPNTGSATTTLQAAIDTLDVELSARIAALEGHLGQPAIADQPVAPLTVSLAYDQLEVEAIEERLRDTNTSLNTILARLRAAEILEP